MHLGSNPRNDAAAMRVKKKKYPNFIFGGEGWKVIIPIGCERWKVIIQIGGKEWKVIISIGSEEWKVIMPIGGCRGLGSYLIHRVKGLMSQRSCQYRGNRLTSPIMPKRGGAAIWGSV